MENSRHRVALIVNPIAGMGGAVALKGTDGDRATRARDLGATPVAAARALKALRALAPQADAIDWISCAGPMGADVLEMAGYPCETVYDPGARDTSARDTRAAAAVMLQRGVDLILFAGGDGTAADLLAVVDRQVPMLGIPAGVKMHSAVFAISPRAAGDVVCAFLAAGRGEALVEEAEILDRPADGPEGASPELVGYARIPVVPLLISHAKSVGASGSVEGACRDALERIRTTELVLLGPGTTLRRIKRALGFDGTLLGVDAVRDGKPAGLDLTASDILRLIGDTGALLVVSVIGGQGFLFGRGNQQLSPEVLRRVGRDRILIVSSMDKLVALPEGRLFVDTGDEAVDASLAGYLPVIVGYRRTVQFAVGLPGAGIHGERADASDSGVVTAANDV